MYSFIVKRQPATFNSWKKASELKRFGYKSTIELSLKKYNDGYTIQAGELYGIVFHFFNEDLKIDADNLSKPLWDCLKDVLYTDDYQIKMRISGSFNLTKTDLNVLNLSGLNGTIINELLDALENENHVVYIECGQLDYSMFKFNLESHGN